MKIFPHQEIEIEQARIRGWSVSWQPRELFGRDIKKAKKNVKQLLICILDNFSGHYVEEEFPNIMLFSISPNITSPCQPLDIGAIAQIKQALGVYVNNCLVDDLELNHVDKKKLVELHNEMSECVR